MTTVTPSALSRYHPVQPLESHLKSMTSAWRLSALIFLSACAGSGGPLDRMPTSTTPESEAVAWSVYLDGLGTFSSPRAADFNRDGVMDVVIGAGREEFMASDSAVIALDGATGRVLWHVGARDQMFGSAAIIDLNKDGVPDVVIGGRSAELRAIDGATGRIIWEFFSADGTVAPRTQGWYNFYNPQFIPDQDGDGIEDLVVANGGDVLAAPDDPNRPAGRLLVVSGKTGRLIASDTMPDGRETYMSAVVADIRGDGELEIIFGSGGETFGGHLFRATLADLLNEDISKAAVLASSTDRGFVGPPVLADVTGDDILDVVANAVDGRMLAFDGADNRPLWTVHLPETEAYTSIATGYFTDDDVPDFFASFAMGEWPDLGWSRQFMVDGKTGEMVFTDSLGLYQTSSPVVFDVNQDGRDEVLMSVNYEAMTPQYRKRFYTMLVVIDFKNQDVLQFGDPFPGSNLSSTPWLGDLDGDGLLDVVFCHTPDSMHTYVFNGLEINRIGTQVRVTEPPAWGSYMGSSYDGIFQRNRGSPATELRR